ncbi:MAG: acyl--CoA ligase [Eubacterium sp.]|jgi:long-chain acyl-CoA synthetase|nr:acyl--CoA ligase [Eubacterium sp.]
MDTASTLPGAIKYYAETTPNKICLIEGMSGNQISYSGFWDGIARFASLLNDKGLRKGDRVVLHTHQTIDHMTAFYGIQIAGGVALPIERGASEQMFKEISDHFDARYLVAAKNFEAGREVILFGEQNNIPETQFRHTMPPENELAAILYTTGTTGKSKGVMSSYKCRYSGADNVRYTYEIKPDDIALIPQVLSHSGALRRVEAMLVSGATAVIMGAAMFFGNVFRAIKKYNVNILQLVPAQVAQILTSASKLLIETAPQFRIVSVGSAVISEMHKEQLRSMLPGVRLFNDFGSTEAIGSAYFEWSKYPPKPDCIGIESIHSRIVLLNDKGEIMENASRDNPGIIATEGDTLMSGYWNDPELTAKVLIDNRLVSSDLGYRGDDGFVYILGRRDDIIVSGANKISPYEIEDVMLGMDVIKECAVVSRPDPIMESVPVLFVAMKDGEVFSVCDIQLYLEARIERFKIPKPKNIINIPSLPRSDGTGKILRKELKKILKEKYSDNTNV